MDIDEAARRVLGRWVGPLVIYTIKNPLTNIWSQNIINPSLRVLKKGNNFGLDPFK